MESSETIVSIDPETLETVTGGAYSTAAMSGQVLSEASQNVQGIGGSSGTGSSGGGMGGGGGGGW